MLLLEQVHIAAPVALVKCVSPTARHPNLRAKGGIWRWAESQSLFPTQQVDGVDSPGAPRGPDRAHKDRHQKPGQSHGDGSRV